MQHRLRTADFSTRRCWTALLLASAACFGACAKPVAEKGSERLNNRSDPFVPRAERLGLFTRRGLLIIHLEIYIDGEAQREAAEHVLDEAAKAAGAQGDVEPSWASLLANPHFASGSWGNMPLHVPAERPRIIEQYDANRDGRVQRSELAAFLAQDNAGGRAFAVQSVNPFRADSRQDSPLFALLDQDQDGRLSAAELSSASVRLCSRDADDDDVVALADFLSAANGEAPMRRGRDFRRDQALELNKLEADSIYYTLCEMVDTGNGLDATSFSLTPGLLAQLDIDHNGAVDQEELAGLVNARPDLLLKVNFGPASPDRGQPGPHQPALELAKLSDDLIAAGARTYRTPGGLQVELPGLELAVLVDDLAAPADPLAAAQARFALFDVDKNELLDADEAAAAGVNLKELDENGDGTLSFAEAKEAFGEARSYRERQVQVRAGQVEDAVFSWLDVNHDDRLTPREMLGAADRLAELDRDGDGLVSAAEIPDLLTCRIVRGAAAQEAMASPRGPNGNPDPAVPRWLAAMDRNADGEISRREFLGTSEQFAEMDTNGDGFLDADEVRHQDEPSP